uniref:C3H1-type domain-containing protein n=1 Tax=Nothobranchius furzeri TaxID=105023 RepID=A0A8C6PVR6_NOTFU
MEESRRDDYDIDACLEHSEEELHDSFLEFYHDVLPEFKSVGSVLLFSLIIREEQSKEAFVKFNGRWYAGRQLQCEVCPVTRWKSAICGELRKKCPKGKHCNFLHVDLQMSPDRSIRGSRRSERHSERYSERSWRQRRYNSENGKSEEEFKYRGESEQADSEIKLTGNEVVVSC